MSIRSNTKKGMVLQVVPGEPRYGRMLVIVDAVKSWGVQAYFWLPDGMVVIRLKWDDVMYVGQAVYDDA